MTDQARAAMPLRDEEAALANKHPFPWERVAAGGLARFLDAKKNGIAVAEPGSGNDVLWSGILATIEAVTLSRNAWKDSARIVASERDAAQREAKEAREAIQAFGGNNAAAIMEIVTLKREVRDAVDLRGMVFDRAERAEAELAAARGRLEVVTAALRSIAVENHETYCPAKGHTDFVPNGQSCLVCEAVSEEGKSLIHKPTCALFTSTPPAPEAKEGM